MREVEVEQSEKKRSSSSSHRQTTSDFGSVTCNHCRLPFSFFFSFLFLFFSVFPARKPFLLKCKKDGIKASTTITISAQHDSTWPQSLRPSSTYDPLLCSVTTRLRSNVPLPTTSVSSMSDHPDFADEPTRTLIHPLALPSPFSPILPSFSSPTAISVTPSLASLRGRGPTGLVSKSVPVVLVYFEALRELR